jgi:antitoxin (DNA-binding transcriptional repressor) of toxin-antitoxin stability system
MKQVRISALKSHLSEHLRRAEAGEIIEVMDRARVIARLVPVEREATVELVSASRSFPSVRNIRLRRAQLTVDSLSALRSERGPT